MKTRFTTKLLAGLAITSMCQCGGEKRLDDNVQPLIERWTVDVPAGSSTFRNYGISRWHVRIGDGSAVVEGMTSSGAVTRHLTIEPSKRTGEIWAMDLDGSADTELVSSSQRATESTMAALVFALNEDASAERQRRVVLQPAGEATLTSCGSHDGVCTTTLWGNGHLDWSYAWGWGPWAPISFAVPDDFLFSYAYANGCNGDKGNGFCLW